VGSYCASKLPPIRTACLAALLLACAGCADAKFLNRTVPQPRDTTAAADAPAPDIRYRVGCPDVLDVSFTGRPECDAYAAVDLDGRLPLEGRPRAEGLTLEEVRAEIAAVAGVSPESVQVKLAAPRSGHLYINGPVRGHTRIVPFQGPEPVIDFLKRVGGLPPGSKLNQVYVVRPHIALGQRSEVFRVNVEAVLIDGDPATNIVLRASDQIYIGESRGSSFSRVLPHWMGTAYRRVAGLLPDHWWPFNMPVTWGLTR
jgi:polysaccharide biosynthesis/export protein